VTATTVSAATRAESDAGKDDYPEKVDKR